MNWGKLGGMGIVGTLPTPPQPPPPPPPIIKEDKPEKGGVDVEMGGCHVFITLQFNHIYCV